MKKTKFTWREWLMTGPEENLLELSKEAICYFRLIVAQHYG